MAKRPIDDQEPEHEEVSISSLLNQEDDVKTTVVKNTPWFAISIGVHAIVIAIFSIQVFRAPPVEETIAINAPYIEQKAEPEVIEAPPVEIDRSAIPEEDEEVTEEEVQDFEPIPTSQEIATGDPNALTEEPGGGFTGGTSIGVGSGGHYGIGVSARAGRLGNNGGKGKYGARAAKAGGGATQKVVAAGLEWLKRHQDPKGFWSPTDFSQQCTTNRCNGEGDAIHGVGVTGLATLAFLGAGNTMEQGQYKEVVRRAIKYLREIQNEETGEFGERTGADGWIYDQALATLAMTEAFGLSGNPALKKNAQKAVFFIQGARNPYKAWRYAHPGNGENDTSVTGWMVMVLESAKEFGLQVDSAAFDGAKLFLDEMTDPSTGRCGYIQRGGQSAREPGMIERWPASKVECMTAVAMMCRIFMGEEPSKSPLLRSGADLLRKSLPVWDPASGQIDFYYWYYGTYAMYQMGDADWKAWEGKMLDAMVKQQRQDGCERGSWDPQVDPWGHRGGRVYSTAIMTLCAEVYYRYTRVIGSRKSAAPTPAPGK